MKKKYIRETKNEVDTFLTRVNKVQRQPELFKDVYDTKGNIVDPSKIKRINELTGAGIEYLTSFVDFICTHFKSSVDKSDADYYTTPEIEWSAALDIMTGNISGQRERAEIAIMQYVSKPKQALIQTPDGHYRSAQPFILLFDWGKKEDLDAKAAARFARLNKKTGKGNKRKKPEKEDDEPRLPINKIKVKFYKPLFDDFFRRGTATYSFPVGMYAKLFKEANDLKRSIFQDKEELAEKGWSIPKGTENLDSEKHVSAYTRFARYIIRHNYLTGEQTKDKKFHCSQKIPIIDFLRDVYPSALSTNGRGEISVDWSEFKEFLGHAIGLYSTIPGFILYPVLSKIDKSFMYLEIYTDMAAADKAEREKEQTPILVTMKQQAAMIKAYKTEHPEMSNRAIARALDIPETTLRRLLLP